MLKKSLLVTAASLFLAASSFATISVELQADLLEDSAGVAIPQSSLFFLVASTGDAVFSQLQAGTSTAVGSLLTPGGDDYIVARGDLSNFGTNGVLIQAFNAGNGNALNLSSIPGWNTGDPLALVWFSNVTLGNSTIPVGAKYGIYTNATAVDGSGTWITPTDPSSSYKLSFFTKDGSELSPGATASNAGTVGRATNTVLAPEPASLSMLGLGALALASRRRRK